MAIIRVAIILAAVLASLPATAAMRSRKGSFCTPVYIEGAGKVLICAPAKTRR